MGREAISRGVSLAFITTLFAVLVGLLAGAASGAAKAPPIGTGKGGVALKRIGDFNEPVYTATAPGKANRKLIFVVERGGAVRVIRNGKTLSKPFLDLSNLIRDDFAERGLLSIAFDPRYVKNRRFYVYYTAAPDGAVTVAQYERAKNSKVVADPGSGRKVISIPHGAAPNHNGGEVTFGPDGNMWLATGDGGSSCDPPENAQNLNSLLGKLLRITPKANGGYRVPHGNPFVNRAGADEIYAYGLRNPFRFSFDPEKKAIAVADVGQNAWEEINYLKTRKASGANFGWDAYEGEKPLVLPSSCRGDTSTPLPGGSTFPILVYPHSSNDPKQYTGCAVIGGPVVRNKHLKSIFGRYLYSDSCNGDLQSLVPHPGGATGDKPLGIGLESPSSITEGRKHRIYTTDLAGPVYQIVRGSGSAPASSRNPATDPTASIAGSRAGDGQGSFRAKPLGYYRDPVYVIGPEGAKGLRFVVEKPGRILAVGPGGRTTTFLDIRNRVIHDGERGLLSVAFPPNYAQSGLFYVYFTDNRGDIVVTEFKRSKKNPRRAKRKSGRRVIRIKHRLNPNHNGGQLQFGPDGYLYFATGDGGSGGDPDENAQNLDSLLGKLIRIDPRRNGNQPYSVPASNPFVGVPGRDEIYSYGLRNPYRFSFDPPSGHLAIGDVGQDTWEEIDYLPIGAARGANFGWDAYEGYGRFDSTDASPIPSGPVTPPIHQYKHVDGNCAVTGGYVSHDPKTPSLDGRYIYADYCKSQVRSLIPADGGAGDDRRIEGLPSLGGVSSFGQDTKGHVYVTDLGGGGVYEITEKR
jgi:glucose/arabinose dehydrogenase